MSQESASTSASITSVKKPVLYLRLDPELMKAVEERAKRHGLSRNAWAELALQRMVEMPTQTNQQRDQRF